MSKEIAEVKAEEPDQPMTLKEWLEWREAENQRMKRDLLQQMADWIDLQTNGTKH